MTEPVCPVTGAPMRPDGQVTTITSKGRSLSIDMPGLYCEASGQSIHTGDDMKVSDQALDRLEAMDEALPLPEEIRAVRKRLAMTRERAGDLRPHRAVASALALLDHDPAALRRLKQRRAARRKAPA